MLLRNDFGILHILKGHISEDVTSSIDMLKLRYISIVDYTWDLEDIQ